MPGLTLWVSPGRCTSEAVPRFTAAQESMLHAPEYVTTIAMADRGLFVGHVKYPEYPVKCFAVGDNLVYFEGRVYNKDARQVQNELSDLAERALAQPEYAKAFVESWMLEAEGEYVVALVDPTDRRLLIFTDPLGRLPLYYHASDSCVLVSRECKFIQQLKPRPAFDRVGWAEYLSLYFALGNRTLFEGICRCPVAMMLRAEVDGDQLRTQVHSLVTINLEEKDHPGKSVRAYASELVDMLRPRCRQCGSHPEVTTNVIALSGGKDSRIALAGMVAAGIPCVARTCLDPAGVLQKDVRVAEQVAALLNTPWKLIRTGEPSLSEMEFLARAKDGQNPVANAYMLRFLTHIVEEWGRGATYVTGHSGEIIFFDPRPPAEVNSIDALARMVLRPTSSRIPVSQAETIMGLPRGTVESELRALVQGYPEAGAAGKAMKYKLYEMRRKHEFEGQDRARLFLWETSPMHAFPLCRYGLRIPSHLKRFSALYREVLKILSPRCAELPESNTHLPLTSRRYAWKCRLIDLTRNLPHGRIRSLARFLSQGRRSPYQVPGDFMSYLQSHVAGRNGFETIMDPAAVHNTLEQVTRSQFEHFWTLVLLEKVAHLRGSVACDSSP